MDPKAAAHLMSAFPTFAKDGEVALSEGGLTMRDYFAAKALQGLLTMPDEWQPWIRRDGDGSTWQAEAAKAAYRLADAMLKAREA